MEKWIRHNLPLLVGIWLMFLAFVNSPNVRPWSVMQEIDSSGINTFEAVDIKQNLTVGGNTDITGDLFVGRNFHLVNDASMDANITIKGNIVNQGDLSSDGNSSIGGNLNVNRDAGFDGNLTVGGTAKISSNLDVSGDFYVEYPYQARKMLDVPQNRDVLTHKVFHQLYSVDNIGANHAAQFRFCTNTTGLCTSVTQSGDTPFSSVKRIQLSDRESECDLSLPECNSIVSITDLFPNNGIGEHILVKRNNKTAMYPIISPGIGFDSATRTYTIRVDDPTYTSGQIVTNDNDLNQMWDFVYVAGGSYPYIPADRIIGLDDVLSLVPLGGATDQVLTWDSSISGTNKYTWKDNAGGGGGADVDDLIVAFTGPKLSRQFKYYEGNPEGEAVISTNNTINANPGPDYAPTTDFLIIDVDNDRSAVDHISAGDYLFIEIGTSKIIAEIAYNKDAPQDVSDDVHLIYYKRPYVYSVDLTHDNIVALPPPSFSEPGTISFTKQTPNLKNVNAATVEPQFLVKDESDDAGFLPLSEIENKIHPNTMKRFTLSGYKIKATGSPTAIGEVANNMSGGYPSYQVLIKPKPEDVAILQNIFNEGFVIEFKVSDTKFIKSKITHIAHVNFLSNDYYSVTMYADKLYTTFGSDMSGCGSGQSCNFNSAQDASVDVISSSQGPTWNDVTDEKSSNSPYEIPTTLLTNLLIQDLSDDALMSIAEAKQDLSDDTQVSIAEAKQDLSNDVKVSIQDLSDDTQTTINNLQGPQIARIWNQYSAGSSTFSCAADTWYKVPLSNETDPSSIVTFNNGSDYFTLAPGNYFIEINKLVHVGGTYHRTVLFDGTQVSGASKFSTGTEFASGSDTVSSITFSKFSTFANLTSSKNFFVGVSTRDNYPNCDGAGTDGFSDDLPWISTEIIIQKL